MILAFTLFSFFCLGAIFGSFSTVLVDRWKKGKSGIWTGRSECTHCHHMLHAPDLIPIVSFFLQRRKCRYCDALIPWRYMIMEVSMATIFVLLAWVGLSWGLEVTDIRLWILILWGFVTGVYIFYDALYMEVPDKILLPALVLIVIIWIIGDYINVK